MRKTKFLISLFAALCLMAFSAQAASALSITGTTPFTGQQVGSAVFNIGTALRVPCTTVSISNGSLASNTLGTSSTNMASFDAAFGGCTATVAGITAPATVGTPCKWSFAPSTYSMGSGTGRLRMCGTISVSSFGCVITIPVQVISSGITYQNAAGGINVIVNIPGGATGIAWTQNGNCPGLPAGSPPYMGLQMTFRLNGLTVIP